MKKNLFYIAKIKFTFTFFILMISGIFYVKAQDKNSFKQITKLESKFIKVMGENNTLKGIEILKQIIEKKNEIGYYKVDSLDYVSNINSLANLHSNIGNFDTALYFYKRVLVSNLLLKDSLKLSTLFSSLGFVYFNFKDYILSLDYYLKSLCISEKVEGCESLSACFSVFAIGNIYYQMNQIDTAIYYFQKSLEIIRKNKNNETTRIINLLHNIGNIYQRIGKHEEAIDAYDQIVLIYKDLGIENIYLSSCLYDIGDIYILSGEFDKGKEVYDESLNIAKKIKGTNSLEYANVLIRLGNLYSAKDNFDLALDYYNQSLLIRENILGSNSLEVATNLNNIANVYLKKDDYKKAIELKLQGLNICNKINGEKSQESAHYLYELGNGYLSMRLYSKAIESYNKSLEIKKNYSNNDSIEISHTIQNLGRVYYYMNQFDKAIEYINQSTVIYEKFLGEENMNVASSLHIIGNIYFSIGNYKNALESYFKSLEISQKIFRDKSNQIANTLGCIGVTYSRMGFFEKAIEYNNKAIDINKQLFGFQCADVANSLENNGFCYSEIGNYTKAFEFLNQSKVIRENIFGNKSIQVSWVLNTIGGIYLKVEDYDKAFETFNNSLEITKNVLGNESDGVAYILNYVSKIYSSLGNYNQALDLLNSSLNIYKKIYGSESYQVALMYSNIGLVYIDMKAYDKALNLFNKCLDIQNNVLGKESKGVAITLNNIGITYAKMMQYEKALENHNNSLDIQKKISGNESIEVVRYLLNLANVYVNMKNYTKALEIYNQNIEYYKKYLGKESIEVSKIIENIDLVNLEIGNYKKALESYSTNLYNSYKNIQRVFSFLPEKDRFYYWEKDKRAIINAPSFAFKSKIFNNTFQGDVYNSLLFSKNILLHSSIEFSQLIYKSEDTLVIKKYNQLQEIKDQLQKQYEIPVKDRVINCDSLETLSLDLEKTLITKSKEYGDYTRNLKITWQDVQKKLSVQDIAIEFTEFNVLNSDSVMYAALLIRKELQYPLMIPLFEKKELENLTIDSYNTTLKTAMSSTKIEEIKKYDSIIYNNLNLYSLIWNPIKSQLKFGDNIYFSAAGLLHQIAIENLRDSTKSLMSDKYKFYRLSSTKDLAYNNKTSKFQTAVLYGGIKYDVDTTTMISESRKYNTTDIAMRSISYSNDSVRGGNWKYLIGTKQEVNKINSELIKSNINTYVYSDVNASEESFKALSGKKTNIIHIATHGFYLTEQQTRKKDFFRSQLMQDETKVSKIDRSLDRSGLLFAGAQAAWDGKKLPETIEDGTLTSREITSLDLRGTDLLVLSACQTGLGEITGDGVFGLQRGFKKAGVKTIVMSLWQVDDNATQLMMSEFYANLAQGLSKREAFTKAQNKLRSMEEYSSPYYWAGFIMLD